MSKHINHSPLPFIHSAKTEFIQLPNIPNSDQYIPLDPHYLSSSRACSFPIYNFHKGRNRFVLFKQENAKIKQEQLDQLTKNGKQPVFVPRRYNFELLHYISESLSRIVADLDKSLEERTQQFHTVATTVMRTLFESPPENKEFIKIAKNVSDSLATLLIEEPSSILKLNLLRSYDYYTYSHSINVCAMSVGLYQSIVPNLSKVQVQSFTRGALLHDIGKCDIPHDLTTKRGSLNKKEWEIMRSHTTLGFERLQEDDGLAEDDRKISLLHHEAIDGSGYPLGLTKENIPFTSRLCKVTDVFDALTSKRPYKNRMPAFEALRLMMMEMKTKIDQDILKQFILFLEKMSKNKLEMALEEL